MSRPPRNEKHGKGRPRRLAAKTHFFKYQLSKDPTKVEQNDLKRALQESLEEQSTSKSVKSNITGKLNNGNRAQKSFDSNNDSTINTSDINSNCNSSSSTSLGSSGSDNVRRTRSGVTYPAKLIKAKEEQQQHERQQTESNRVKQTKFVNGHHERNNNNIINCDNKARVIRTYSRSQPLNGPRSSTPIDSSSDTIVAKTTNTVGPPTTPIPKKASQTTFSTQGTQTSPPLARAENGFDATKVVSPKTKPDPKQTRAPPLPTPPKEQYLKPKRESKSDAYAKISAMNNYLSYSYICNASSFTPTKRSPSGSLTDNGHTSAKVSPRSIQSPTSSPANTTQVVMVHQPSSAKKNSTASLSGLSRSSNEGKPIIIRQPAISIASEHCDKRLIVIAKSTATSSSAASLSAPATTRHLITTTASATATIPLELDLVPRKVVQSSWTFLGVPEEKLIYLRNDEPPRRLICYPAIKHIEGDVIQVRDSVLLRSGAKKTDLPYIAKVCAFWQDASTGAIMMSLFWYYRPEHTEDGRRPHHLIDEIFASRHRDVDSVDCIEDKCYVLTFNEYCRYRKRCKMEQVKTTWSLADATIPASNEAYPKRNRIPESGVNPELVFCCRQIYDSRMKRLIKNPLINPKYGHI